MPITSRSEGNKYIVGWLQVRPERLAEFTQAVSVYGAACRNEPECLFFDLVPHVETANRFVLSEAFVSEGAHVWHHQQDHYRHFSKLISELCTGGHIENVIAASVKCEDFDFEKKT
jgi:quinol monooxygenase YgiN